jgi:predicted PurR-regulated permease PerM
MNETEREGPRDATRTSGLTHERVITLLLLAATAVAFYVCYLLALPFLPAVTWALALAVVAQPLHGRILGLTGRPNLAAALSVLVVALLITGPGVLLARQLVGEAGRGLEALKAQTEQGRWQATLEGNPKLARAVDMVAPGADVRGGAERLAGAAGSYLSSFVGGSLWALAQLLMTFFTLFYLFRDRRTFLKGVRSLLPLSQSETDRLFARVSDTVYATFYGTFAVSLVQGLLGGLMFWWLGLPAPLLWGVVMFLLSLVPVLGAPVVWGPAALFLAATGAWGKALILAAWGVAVIGSIDNLLYPVLVGDRVRMHTLLVFFSVIGGILLFGAAGLVLGPVAVVITTLLIEVWRGRLPDDQSV